MEIASLLQLLDDPQNAAAWLRQLGAVDPSMSQRFLRQIADAGVPVDLLSALCAQLETEAPLLTHPDMAFNNLARFFQAARSPLSLATLFHRQHAALRTVLQIGSTSQFLSDLLIEDPESLDLLQMTEGQPVARQLLIDEICAEADSLDDEAMLKSLLRRYKQRETLRIAYGDIVRRQPCEEVARQLSHLADAILEAAVRFAQRAAAAKRGVPQTAAGRDARFAVVAMGKLAGQELSYSQRIELVFLCDENSRVGTSRSHDGLEYFTRLAQHVVELLGASAPATTASRPMDEPIYTVDTLIRPRDESTPLVATLQAALRHYDVAGRTHERLAFIKARPCAGDSSLAGAFLREMEPWVFRRYLGSVDIAGIKALKRRIERQTARAPQGSLERGPGGVRDIEFVIQYLQLLNGGSIPELRTANTLAAISQLEAAGCLTNQERTMLEESYSFLRRAEHRLQVMFQPQSDIVPTTDPELTDLALRMDFRDVGAQSARNRFSAELDRRRAEIQQTLRHLLHDAFADSSEGEAEPIADLVLDPAPSADSVDALLKPFRFRDNEAAHHQLLDLAEEKIPFLSTRRCRHYLAAIAPQLLRKLAETPDPDGALQRLCQVSDSLGGKGGLWELFSASPATLDLYVRLCATSDYLTGILNAQPGMVDELMDSLVLKHLPSQAALARQLDHLCHGTDDLSATLASFKNQQHLRIGVRDLLNKNEVEESHTALTHVAEVILRQVAFIEMRWLVEKHGRPLLDEAGRSEAECLIMAQGKLGGQEPNYHSDLDLVFLFEGAGRTHPDGARQKQTTNQHFFSQLGQRIIKRMSQLGVTGQLYSLNSRLRPTGGDLAFSLPALLKYFHKAGDWRSRMALCKARIVVGSGAGSERAIEVVRAAQFHRPWSSTDQQSMIQYRRQLERNDAVRNLKRGPGGTLDVEYIVQSLQMRHGSRQSEIMLPNTLEALAALRATGLLTDGDAAALADDYRFLRAVESRLRLLNTVKRHDLPQDPIELRKLAYLLHGPSAHGLFDTVLPEKTPSIHGLELSCQEATARIRDRYRRLVENASDLD